MSEDAKSESWRGKVGGMTQDEMEEFLAGKVLCRLGVLDRDGWPYVVPVWYQYKDGGFYIIPRERSNWARYMENDKRVYLDIDEEGSLRKVLVKGEAELVEDGALEHLDAVTRKYTSHPRYYGYVFPMEKKERETRIICRIHARKITLDAIHG